MNKLNYAILKSFFTGNKILTRSLKVPVMKDPGIRRRANLINEAKDFENIDLDEMEADFHNVGKSHQRHEQDREAIKEQEKYYIVRQKYFKEKLPNYLTWADKQQIKHLHSTNPEEWTIEKLSEGFPALPDIIHNIIKNDWTPRNANRIRKHNDTVQQNWKDFKNGKTTDLPRDLRAHLSKFTSRDLNLNIEEDEGEDVTKRKLVKEGGEFSQIILSYEALKSKKEEQAPQPLISDRKKVVVDNANNNLKETSFKDFHLANKKKNQKLITYEQLQENLGNHSIVADADTKSNDLEGDVAKEITLKPEEVKLNISKFESAKSDVNYYKPKRDYSNLYYPEHITIPANKRRKGYTYKLNDCFYDDDGSFLYRVPGIA